MNERRRLLMAQQENNPWEKLDDLTFIAESGSPSFWIDHFTVSVYYKDEYAEEEELIERVTSTLLYSLDDGKTWQQEDDRLYITLNTNETVKLRSNLAEIVDVYNYYKNMNNDNYVIYSGDPCYIYSNTSGKYSLAGSPMSLLRLGEITYELPDFPGIFSGLFTSHDNLKQILNPKTFLPFKKLSPSCYSGMFTMCRYLINAPKLPATELTERCYSSMFSSCYALETAPNLPATTLASGCYNGMFSSCSSLTTAPKISATILADNCCQSMFRGCTSLETAPDLPATTLATDCYYEMFRQCNALKTAPSILPATELNEYCYYGMFSSCSSLTTAPALPATTLARDCYSSMFSYCTSLTAAPDLPATTLADSCYNRMFYCCRSLNYIKALFIKMNSHGTYYWVEGVSSTTGTFVKNKDATWNETGVHGVPSGWTVITE